MAEVHYVLLIAKPASRAALGSLRWAMFRKGMRQSRVSMEGIMAAATSRLMRLAQKMIVGDALLLDRGANSHLQERLAVFRRYERQEFEHIVRVAAAITGETEFIIIGSQSILGKFPDAPRSLRQKTAWLGSINRMSGPRFAVKRYGVHGTSFWLEFHFIPC